MQRFYFHLRRGKRLIPDEDGIELHNLRTAKREALHGAREILAEAIKIGANRVPDALLIVDGAGLTLHEQLLVDVLPKPLRRS